MRAVFASSLVLAATLSANYGIYGPTFELMESTPREPGSEEYRDSEKYQLRHWDLDRPDSLAPLIARVNRIRRDNPALQSDRTLTFCRVDNDRLIDRLRQTRCRLRRTSMLTVVNLDPYNHAQSGWVELDLRSLDIDADSVFKFMICLSDQRYPVARREQLRAAGTVAHAGARVPAARHVRSERDFDYFL